MNPLDPEPALLMTGGFGVSRGGCSPRTYRASVEETNPAAFLSYAHEDDRFDGGEIVALAERLGHEYALLTGADLDIFVDRKAIRWGDEWRSRIESGLKQTTFFIPVLTPRYFRRPECRNEFLEFYGQAQSLGLPRLIMPILYVTVTNFESDNSDELVAIASSRQYADWRERRIDGFRSREYRVALNELAARLVEIGDEVAAVQFEREVVTEGGGDEPGLLDLMEEIEKLLDGWVAALERADVCLKQTEGTHRAHEPKLNKLQGMAGSARIATIQRYSQDSLPIVSNALAATKEYAAKSMQLDPLIMAALRHIESEPGLASFFKDTWRRITDSYRPEEVSSEIDLDKFRSFAGLSRSFAKIIDMFDQSARLAVEGDKIVERWIDYHGELTI